MDSEKSYRNTLRLWTEDNYFDALTRQELLAITDPKELEDRFYMDLEFGTAGLRGVLGAGTNRMNRYVIRKVTQGLADMILAYGQQACLRGVVIAYDNRRFSREFALETALVLATNKVKAFLFESLRPTPELSFAVRYLGTIAGVNITASHNPKEYNGYKVYWEDGGQIPPLQAEQIALKMAETTCWEVYPMDENAAREAGLLTIVGPEVDAAYESEIQKTLLSPNLTRTEGKNLKIVFTPLHGTGGIPVQRALQNMGFTSLWTVPEQEQPDPEFATVNSPNPEDPSAFIMALNLAKEKEADLVLATDPDADRVGIYARDRQGAWIRFTGNQIGVILEYYVLSQKNAQGTLPENGVVVKTVASTDLGDAIAMDFGMKAINVHVGFKYIGEQIRKMEEGWGTFLFGFEESHGYLAGTYARDKDAVQAAALLAEAALYFSRIQNKTLPEVLEHIFKRYGTYLDEQVAVTLSGKQGKESIDRIMDRLRVMKPNTLGGLRLEKIEDYQIDTRLWLATGRREMIGLPQANVLRFSFEGGGYVMVRPSGTEPKIRFYFCLKGQTMVEAEAMKERVKAQIFSAVDDLMR
ncbi:phospho-sugar mutase [Dehalobacter sp. DCM]|uniref:phospho-sugar mutase n=1 Tax=Dehalobacter sp. DCM TaxID=2907827 RepID=UPI00308183C6|nr:phospho-sugar mutase [Dehalobacter sp. DCM]